MLSHACRGLGALPLCWVLHSVAQALLGLWQRWPWHPPFTRCRDSGAGCGFLRLAVTQFLCYGISSGICP